MGEDLHNGKSDTSHLPTLKTWLGEFGCSLSIEAAQLVSAVMAGAWWLHTSLEPAI
jgi:hypothetical protein